MKLEKGIKMNSPTIFENCRIQRNPSFLARIEDPTKKIHFFNIRTGQVESLPKEVTEIWESLNGRESVDRVTRHLLRRRSEGNTEGILNELKQLIDDELVYVVEESKFDEDVIPSRFQQLLDQIPVPKSTIHWLKETPDISLILEAGLGNPNLFFLLDNYYGRIWALLVGGYELRKIISTIYSEYGQISNYEHIIDFILFLKDQGFISFQNDYELRDPPLAQEFSTFEEWNRKNKFRVETFIKKTSIPWFTTWELNYECNFQCNHCYTTKDNDWENLSEIEKKNRRKVVLERILDSNLIHITLMGGEPLLVPELPEIIRILRQNNIYTKLVTNGSLLGQEQVQLFEKSGLNQIEVSLDGTTSQINDLIRGKGTYAKILKGIQNLKNSSIPKKGICYTVTTVNWQDVDNVPGFVRELGLDEVFFSKFTPSGRGELHLDWVLSEAQRTELTQKVETMNNDQFDVPLEHKINFWTKLACSAAKTWCVITPSGKVKPCTLHNHMAGDLQDASLQYIWNNSREFIIMRYPYLYLKACRECDKYLTCNTCICNALGSVNSDNLEISGCIKERGTK